MTNRDLFGLQSNLLDDMKELFADETIKTLFDNLDLYDLSLNELESLHEDIEEARERNDYEEIQGLIAYAIERAKEM